MGDGVTAAAIEYNPEISEEVYIHQDSATAEVERYGPKMPLEAVAIMGMMFSTMWTVCNRPGRVE